MSGSDDSVQRPGAAPLSDEALLEEIRSNRRTERRLLVVAGLAASVSTVVVLVLHGPVS